MSISPQADIAPDVIIEADEVTIAAGVKLLPGTVLRGKSIRIDRRAELGPDVRIDCREVIIGEETMLRARVTAAGLALPDSKLDLGRRVRVFQDTFLNPSKPLTVGDESGLGGRSLIFTHAAWQSILEGYPVEFAPITIGRNVWLPWQVFVLPGVEIGDDVTVAAGSVISRSIPGGSLAAGYPARVLKRAPDYPPTPEPDEQWEIARRVFRDLAWFLTERGETVSASESEGLLSLGRVALVRSPEVTPPPAAEVVASLVGRPTVAAGVTWLALLERERGGADGSECELAEAVAEFVSRYGLRFQRISEA
ncbi:MAG: putative lipid biosynthesis protein [Solirubrobacterales bacterium]|nr:putative lipid biosynthesis protein [Solirubrobacterales bacterium]